MNKIFQTQPENTISQSLKFWMSFERLGLMNKKVVACKTDSSCEPYGPRFIKVTTIMLGLFVVLLSFLSTIGNALNRT